MLKLLFILQNAMLAFYREFILLYKTEYGNSLKPCIKCGSYDSWVYLSGSTIGPMGCRHCNNRSLKLYSKGD